MTTNDSYAKPKAPHTSYSQLDTYRTCSLKYWFRYIDKQQGPRSLALARGSAGHLAIEKNHRRKAKDGIGITKEDLLDTFSDAYEAETTDLALEPGDNLAKTKDDVVDSLTVYHYDTNPKLLPIAAELEFNLDLPATEEYEYPIRIVNGRIDLVDRSGILDAKFASRRKSQPEVDESWQLTLYEMVFEQMTGLKTPNVGLMVFLPPTTRNPADVQVLLRSPGELVPAQRQRRRDRLEYVLRTTQKAIDAGIYMPADDPKVCSWCEYRTTCKSSLAKDDFAAIALRQKG